MIYLCTVQIVEDEHKTEILFAFSVASLFSRWSLLVCRINWWLVLVWGRCVVGVAFEDPLSTNQEVNILITSPIYHIHLSVSWNIIRETLCWNIKFGFDKKT